MVEICEFDWMKILEFEFNKVMIEEVGGILGKAERDVESTFDFKINKNRDIEKKHLPTMAPP